MKRISRIFLVLLFLGVALAAIAWWMRPGAPPEFSVRSRTITPKVTPSFSVGQNFAAFIAPDGTLWAWGEISSDRDAAALRLGPNPRQLSRDSDWKKLAAGFYGFLALKQDGSLWAMGANIEGLTGIESTNKHILELTRVGADTDWREIKAGVSHCMAQKKDGSIWVWGQNNYGQAGAGFLSRREPPTRIGFDTNWIDFSPGAFNCYALHRDGTIWMWGIGIHTVTNFTLPRKLAPETNWVSISAGDYHLIATDRRGTNWLVGANAHMLEAGAPNPATNWIPLSAALDWRNIQSGENCFIGQKPNGQWALHGEMFNHDPSEYWQFPTDFNPLAIHIESGAMLFMMPDGRLWSMGKRLGAEEKPNPLQKLWNTIQFRLFNKSPNMITPSDQRPRLVWEQ